MNFLGSTFFLFVVFILMSLAFLGIGILLSKTERFHLLGIRLIAMSMLTSGRFISSRCCYRGKCSELKCGNWNCNMY